MSNKVNITLAGNSKEVERAYDRLQKENDQLAKKLDKMKDKSTRATRETSSGLERSAASAKRFAIELIGIGSAMQGMQKGIGAMFEEMDKRAKQNEAKRLAAAGFAVAARDARFNFTPDKTLSDEGLEAALQKIAKETRSDPAVVAALASGAFTAKGSLTAETALNSVRRALEIKPNNVEQGSVLSSRYLDVAKKSGLTDIRAIAGFESNFQAASRVQDPAKLGQNLIPKIGAGLAFGDTPEQSAELLSAIGHIIDDEIGAKTANAFSKLGSQLLDFVPQRAKKGQFEGQLVGKDAQGEFAIPDEQFQEFQKATNTQARLAVMRQNQELQRGFIGSASFHETSKQQMFQFIRGEQFAVDELKKAKDTVQPLDAAQAERFHEKLGRLEGGKFQRFQTAQEKSRSNLSSAGLEDTKAQNQALARKILIDTFEGTDDQAGINLPGLDSASGAFRKRRFDVKLQAGENPFKAALFELESLKTELNQKEFNPFKLKFIPSKTATDFDNRVLDEQIELLKEQKEAAEGNARPASAATINKTASAVMGGIASSFGDPQVQQMLRQMEKIAENTSELKRPNPPRTTQRPTARVSRSE